ncbi:HalOD1 output domain-containing protein [Haladaptatus sp. W1]|uniref:HalOD1 output domain-containing protein n=1 Tax=Haladaptatus sp. W1 TaxID=1897478 RepID=UPI00373FCE7C
MWILPRLKTASSAEGRRQTRDSEGSVSFRYNQYHVEVASDGWITVSEPTAYGDCITRVY